MAGFAALRNNSIPLKSIGAISKIYLMAFELPYIVFDGGKNCIKNGLSLVD
jgi:hypothetical protein